MKQCLECENIFNDHSWVCPSCGYFPAYLNGLLSHAPGLSSSSSGFKSEYFSALANVESKNFWFRARNELIIWALRTYQPSAESLLEVGCGTGFVLSGISKENPHIALSGSEIFLDGLSHAAKRVPGATFMQMDARRVPFSEEFDVIGAFDVLEHIEEDEVVLPQLYKALKPGGVLLLTVPQHPWLWSAADEYACHVRRYTKKDLENKIYANNFLIERSTSFVSILLPAMLLSRRKKIDTTTDHDFTKELRLPSVLNECFYTAMKLEQKIIQFGLNFSIGGSRLVVARKKG